MGNLNVITAGCGGFAAEVGKKGTVTDMTFYELKKGNDSVTLIEPSKYPEKLSSLFFATAMAEYAILVVDAIDAKLGETIVMLDSMEIDKGWIIYRNYIQPEQLKPLITGTCLESYEQIDDNAVAVREMLLDLASSVKKEPENVSCGSCPVDSHFNVKGVGTVVLGSVIHGCFKKHDKMKVFPIGKEVVLKSIQKHDIDSDFGIQGDHVGLALRGIDSDELDRGFVLTTDSSIKTTKSISGRAKLVSYWRTPIKEGMVMHIGHWMQTTPCRVKSSTDDGDFHSPVLDLEFESEIIHRPGDKALMMYLEGGKLRIVGSIILE